MTIGSIVCVDDRRDVLAALLRDLSELEDDYEFLPCESAGEAHQVIQEASKDGTLSLLITDHRMPGESGLDLMGRLESDESFSNLPTLLLTGDANHDEVHALQASGRPHPRRYDVLPKPWNHEQLMKTVKSLLG